MSAPTLRPRRAASPIAMAGLGLVLGGTAASGQVVFDPYQPYSEPYHDYTTPSIPTNLALPNAARESGEYAAAPSGFGSRYNTFERYLSGNEPDRFSSRPGNSYDPRSRPNAYLDNLPPSASRGGDDRYYQIELERARRESRRDQLYRAYTRETNPERKVAILREIRQLSGAHLGAPAPARSGASASRGSAPPPPRSSGSPFRPETRPSSPSGTGRPAATPHAPEPPGAARRAPATVTPSPSAPSRSSTTAPTPPAGTGAIPEPDPIPDVPPPPR